MSFQQPSVDSLLRYLNAANGTSFALADVTFSNPKVVAGTWREGSTEKNTAIRVLGVESGKYQGRAVLTYDRLNLASLANIPGFQVKANNVDSVHDILANLAFYTGVKLTTDDVEDTTIVDDGNGNLSAVVSAKANSKGWVGSISVPVLPGGVRVGDVLTQDNLPGLNYPTANDTDTYGLVYLYGYDFTTYFADLQAIAPGALSSQDADKLVTALKALDVSSGKDLWNNTALATQWCLNGATVVRSGLNSNSLPTNQAYKYVLGLQLRDGVTIPSGVMYLHYNDPFDPNDF